MWRGGGGWRVVLLRCSLPNEKKLVISFPLLSSALVSSLCIVRTCCQPLEKKSCPLLYGGPLCSRQKGDDDTSLFFFLG